MVPGNADVKAVGTLDRAARVLDDEDFVHRRADPDDAAGPPVAGVGGADAAADVSAPTSAGTAAIMVLLAITRASSVE
jgi:hypothetical protein